MSNSKLPTLKNIRDAGVSIPQLGTKEFNNFLNNFMNMKISVDKLVSDLYTIREVKKFLTKCSHAQYADALSSGKMSRGYYHEIKPSIHHRVMRNYRAEV